MKRAMKLKLALTCVILFVGNVLSAGETTWPDHAAMSDRVFPAGELEGFFRDGMPWRPYRVDLAPAQWVWFPCGRTLPNTFVLFRRELELEEMPRSATGWITADSRYRLTVNGKRVQWGPAPYDPRQMDVDPMDITALLRPGKNVIGVEVLHYGLGDGTWPAGKPGFLFSLRLDYGEDRQETIVSDREWHTFLDRAHRPGQYKRWFLRALQEEFDARIHPHGWDTPEFVPDARWVPAMPIGGRADLPSGCCAYGGSDLLDNVPAHISSLRIREIPMLKETILEPKSATDFGLVRWHRDPDDWFDLRMHGSFSLEPKPLPEATAPGQWTLPATGEREGAYLIFCWEEQVVGWPVFEIDAPEGTVIELMVQEAHNPKGTPWLDTQFFAWSRFICREGLNRFEPFDFESLRWLQLHVHGNDRPVTIRNVGVRRRMFDWSSQPVVRCAEPELQRLFDATLNTIYNCAQETIVDGMARERQQYSGDGSHQLHAIRAALGEPRLGQRFLRTFGAGISPDGYFMDSWPACDRLYRVAQRQIYSYWGPLLDHGVGFCFDNWNHYLETGDLAATNESYPQLLRFADYLDSIRGEDGLLPVENLGVPAVWIDHSAFARQSHKKCAFNLYTAAMLLRALAPLAEARGDQQRTFELRQRGETLLKRCREEFWDPERRVYISNRPWLAHESIRFDDRSLAMSIFFDLCPDGDTDEALRMLVECPPEMGFSYPCNACWRYWGLAKAGRADVVLNELRTKWAVMPSVVLNNTLAEDWTSPPDSIAQWSHCAVCPIFCLFMDIAGIRPTAPGFTECEIRPQLHDLGDLEIEYHTPLGPIAFSARKVEKNHEISITPPPGCQATLVLPEPGASGQFRRIPLTPGEIFKTVL